MSEQILQYLKSVHKRHQSILEEMNQITDFQSDQYLHLTKEYQELLPIHELYEEIQQINQELEETQQILDSKKSDLEWINLAKQEKNELLKQRQAKFNELKSKLYAKKQEDSPPNIIMEIRSGTGGKEATLFVAQLYRMYLKYSEKKKWKHELLSMNATESGGCREVVFALSGKNVYRYLQYEMGGHRVQRIPVTESSGRIHTSAVTVAVLPELDETELEIKPNDLKIDVYRSSSPGGQSVNTTDSAVRITHLPTGLVAQCQDEKSQHKNKAKAMRVLKARVQGQFQEQKMKELAEERKEQIGSGDRSERIRTYNFPQNRITDHRSSVIVYNRIESVLEGNLDFIIYPLLESLAKKNNLESINNAS